MENNRCEELTIPTTITINTGRLNMTLDDIERKRFEDAFAEHDRQLGNIQKAMVRMFDQTDTIKELRSRIEYLESKLPVELDKGRLPDKDKITRIECQVFHDPDLTPNQKKAKTEWSLRLTVYINGRRAKPDRNVRLYEGERFWEQVMKFEKAPVRTRLTASVNRTKPDTLAGMMQALTHGAGSPYMPDQFCMLTGHETGNPQVEIRIGNDVIKFDSCRPAKGEKKGHALWYLDWRQKA